MPRRRKPAGPFRYFKSSPEVIRIAVLLYVRFPLSLRNVEDLLFERGYDISYETGQNMVEAVRFDVCIRYSKAARFKNEGLSPLVLAP